MLGTFEFNLIVGVKPIIYVRKERIMSLYSWNTELLI